jgi:hypothetical protein
MSVLVRVREGEGLTAPSGLPAGYCLGTRHASSGLPAGYCLGTRHVASGLPAGYCLGIRLGRLRPRGFSLHDVVDFGIVGKYLFLNSAILALRAS